MTDKALIRKDALVRRDAISEELKNAKDGNIRERLLGLQEFSKSAVILLYASLKSEVDTFEAIKYCLSNNKTVVLPKVNRAKDALILYEIRDISELAKGHFGVPEPSVSEDRRRDITGIDVVIVPGVAFDEGCNRLGYGKGFYDKLFSPISNQQSAVSNNRRKTCRIALAYEEQIVERIPAEPHDMKMDKIITDKRTITCNG